MPKKKTKTTEADSAFFLKILLFLILGTFWLRLTNVSFGPFTSVSLPVGLIVGLLFAMHEHFQIDRKMEYAFLLIATVMSFYLPMGIVI
jgi:Na+/H+ antiporter NhaC